MCTLWTSLLKFSIPDVPFPVLLSTLIRSRSQANPSWSPLIFPFLFAVEELYCTRYQSGSFSLINVGSGFYCLRSFSFSFFFSRGFVDHAKQAEPHFTKAAQATRMFALFLEISQRQKCATCHSSTSKTSHHPARSNMGHAHLCILEQSCQVATHYIQSILVRRNKTRSDCM